LGRSPARLAAVGGDPFDALGDPNPRAIVELLAAGGWSVKNIADPLPISRPAVSRQEVWGQAVARFS